MSDPVKVVAEILAYREAKMTPPERRRARARLRKIAADLKKRKRR